MIEKDKVYVGQTVYTYNHWSDVVEKGHVTEIHDAYVDVQGECVVDRNDNVVCTTTGTGGTTFEDLHETAQAAYAAQELKVYEKAAKYCEEITDVPKLLAFALDHCLCGEEYTDYPAIKAYKASAKRLLGIDL